jgi:hypothetical protein
MRQKLKKLELDSEKDSKIDAESKSHKKGSDKNRD